MLAKLRRNNEENTGTSSSPGRSRRPSSSSSSITSKSGSLREWRELNRAYYESGEAPNHNYQWPQC